MRPADDSWVKDSSSQVPKAVPVSEDARDTKDSSDSLLLQEQAKSLPEGIAKGTIDTSAHDRAQRVKDATGKSEHELMALLTDAERLGRQFLQQYVNPARERSYKAFRNEHFQGSKYDSKRYKMRSKLFKPKTRASVRKAEAAAAGALFASADVVTIQAQDNSNQQQLASAALKQELLNYRLDRTGTRDSIPWFEVCMGAHQDAMIASVCVTKQYWKFRERNIAATEGGQDALSQTIVDRPDSLLLPPENVVIDPNCEWTRPAQTSSYLILRYPMPVHEVRTMMKDTGRPDGPVWFPIDDDKLLTLSGMAPDDVQAVRNARSSGADGQSINQGTGEYRILWIYENFLQIDGEDYTFWSIGNQDLLTLPEPTYKKHPAFFGDRPVTIGKVSLEAHRPIPMAPVESWQQLQQEANDITNLRLDQMKQVVTPVAKVKRGRQVDVDQIMRRGQDTVLMLTDLEDVEWDRPPDVPPSAMAEGNILNNDFDELAGVFSNSSVQSNRSMNETVGGMNLLNGAANSVTEFDLRVFVETWVEPTLWQLVKLEEYYESDEKILALAGQKAQLVDRFGIDVITDHLLSQDVTIRVAAGIGAADPMQGLAKFGQATQIFGQVVAPFIQAGAPPPVMPNFEEFANEIYSKAGYKNAAERFFTFQGKPDPNDPNAPPDPAALQAQAHQQQIAAEQQDKQQDRQLKATIEHAKLEDKAADRQHKEKLQVLKSQTEIQRARETEMGRARQMTAGHQHTANENHVAHAVQMMLAEKQARVDAIRAAQEAARNAVQQRQQTIGAAQDRAHAADQAEQGRKHEAVQKSQDRQHTAAEAHATRQHSSQEAEHGRKHEASQAERAAKAKAAEAKSKPKPDAKKKAA